MRLDNGSNIGLLIIHKFGSPYVPPRTLSFNPRYHHFGQRVIRAYGVTDADGW
jgi:hypothetical protein